MQPNPPPPGPAIPQMRSRFGLLLVIAVLVLIAVAGIGGYLIGASGVGHATLRVQVTNHSGSNLTAQVTVNGALAATVLISSGQTASMDVPVAYATANGASFDVEASTTTGPRDSTSVFVNTPGIFVVTLQLG
jgi:hypothetical protein